eukprot:Gb_16009 [translate_table: standard]
MFIGLVVSLIILIRIGESTPIPPRRCFSKIYGFGDSFTDTGNTRSATGPNSFNGVSSPPYGETYFHRPTNRYSDGRLVVDFIAQALGLPLLQPYLNKGGDFSHGVNFAVAGSTVLDHEFFTQRNITLDRTPQSLGTQLQWYSQFIDSLCNTSVGEKVNFSACKYRNSVEALYWIGEIGVNDYAYTSGSGIPTDSVTALTIDKTSKFLEALIQGGARYMLVQGMPLIGCLPMSMAFGSPEGQDQFGCVKSENELSQLHNSLLQKTLERLQQEHPHTLIVYADYYGAHSKVLQNPMVHATGFKNTRSACCGAGGGTYNFDIFATCGEESASVITGEKATSCADPGEYVNWDGVHFTEAMHSVIANMFLQGEFSRPPFNNLLVKKRCLRS